MTDDAEAAVAAAREWVEVAYELPGDVIEHELRQRFFRGENVADVNDIVLELVDRAADLRTAGASANDAGPAWTDPTVTLAEFIAKLDDHREPALLACVHGTVLPVGGLGLLVGKPAGGKTSHAIDLALHAAGAFDYIGLTFPRPLRVLIVQNEGPRHAFQQKLTERLRTWAHGGEPIRVWDEPARWGLVKLSDDEQRDRFRRVVEQHSIDLAISDSLTRFGMRGNGTPEETRDFLGWLTEAGLGRDIAFLLVHHPRTRTEPSEDELEQIAGAWAPHADAIAMLKKLPSNRARLSWPKLRWAHGTHPAAILAFDPQTEAFTHVADETDDDGVTPEEYEQRLLDYLADHPWPATEDLDKGAGGHAQDVRAARRRLHESGRILSAPSATVGRPGKATRWNLAPTQAANPVPLPGTDTDETSLRPAQAAPTPSPRPSVRGKGLGTDGDADTPNEHDQDEIERLAHEAREAGL